jgi:flagellin
MALYVNTNVSSKNAQRMLANSTNSLDTSYKRLASGLRINSAKDDAAGLQISNRLTSQINGLEQGNRNAQDGISYAQTAEGAMDEITSMFQRIRTLAIQSANGTNSEKDRVAIQQEVSQLCAEIDRIAKDTTFGGQALLEGEVNTKVSANKIDVEAATPAKLSKDISFQVGADHDQIISIKLGNDHEVTTQDATGADVTTNYVVGFNMAGIALAAEKLDTGSTFIDTIVASDATDKSSGFVATKDNGLEFDVSTAEGAQNVLEHIDNFIQVVDSKRAELGAVQNRLESTIRNQSNIHENVSDARSRIRDTDFATETAMMTEQSILQQASQNILTQANQRPQLALSLLGG